MKKEDLEVGMMVETGNGDSMKVTAIGNVHALVLDADVSAMNGETAHYICTLRPLGPTITKDPTQPYLPEYERVEVVTNEYGRMLSATPIQKVYLAAWLSRKDFAGFEYAGGVVSCLPGLSGGQGPGVERPLYVLIKTGEA